MQKYLIVHRPVGAPMGEEKHETIDKEHDDHTVASILNGAVENGHECRVYSEDGNTLLGQVENGVVHVTPVKE